jgi:transcriptional regulator with XRE-family HTH domain
MYHEADVHIGRRVRERRTELGISQIALGERLGVSYQQIQKYETGANRISGSRLWELSIILKTPVGYFFDGLEGGAAKQGGDGKGSDEPLGRSALELARAVNAISDDEVKTQILRLAKAFAKAS